MFPPYLKAILLLEKLERPVLVVTNAKNILHFCHHAFILKELLLLGCRLSLLILEMFV